METIGEDATDSGKEEIHRSDKALAFWCLLDNCKVTKGGVATAAARLFAAFMKQQAVLQALPALLFLQELEAGVEVAVRELANTECFDLFGPTEGGREAVVMVHRGFKVDGFDEHDVACWKDGLNVLRDVWRKTHEKEVDINKRFALQRISYQSHTLIVCSFHNFYVGSGYGDKELYQILDWFLLCMVLLRVQTKCIVIIGADTNCGVRTKASGVDLIRISRSLKENVSKCGDILTSFDVGSEFQAPKWKQAHKERQIDAFFILGNNVDIDVAEILIDRSGFTNSLKQLQGIAKTVQDGRVRKALTKDSDEIAQLADLQSDEEFLVAQHPIMSLVITFRSGH